MSVERRKVTFKLYPTPKQAAALQRLLEAHRQLYNAALEERISAWRHGQHSISYEDQSKSLTLVREALPDDWAWMNCSSQQVTLRRLQKAFAAFFARCKRGQAPGFPRFKSLSRMPGFGYKSHGDGWRFTPGADGRHGTLRLQEAGHIKARGQARTPLKACTIKSCELLHEHGSWQLSLTVECQPERLGGTKAGAADWGVNTLLTIVDDAGAHEVANPRLSRAGMDRQVQLQQAASRAQRGSKGWQRACKALRSFKRRQARRRLDEQHKASTRIAADYFAFAMEKLSVKNMTASAAGTADAPGKNVQQLGAARRSLGLTQAELADRIGVNRMTVARAEGEGADPQLSAFLGMALALNCKVAVVAEDKGDSAPLPKNLVHRGLSHARTRHGLAWRDRKRERALAQAWEAANRDEGLSPILAALVPGCTQAQASACATVVQWLGSDVGFGFLQQALERAGYAISEKKGQLTSFPSRRSLRCRLAVERVRGVPPARRPYPAVVMSRSCTVRRTGPGSISAFGLSCGVPVQHG